MRKIIRSTKSNAEIEVENAIMQMDAIILQQKVEVKDAKHLINTACKILLKCEELRKSRDNWRIRTEIAESKIKNG